MASILKLRWGGRNIPDAAFRMIRVTGRKGALLPLHTHDFAEVFWIEQGRCRHQVNRSVDIVEEGEVIFIRPGDIHRLSAIGHQPFHLLNVEIAPSWISRIRKLFPHEYRMIYPPRRPLPFKLKMADRSVLERLHQMLATRPANGMTLVCWWIELLTFLLNLNEPALPPSIPAWLSRGCRQIRLPENLAGGVKRFAQFCGHGEAHVTRSCTRYLKQSAMNYVIQSRCDYARNQLMHGNETIKEIAETCGYGSLSQFYKIFKREYGQSPAKLRQNLNRT